VASFHFVGDWRLLRATDQFGDGVLVALRKFIECLSPTVVASSGKAAHVEQAVRHAAEGREYDGEMVATGVVRFEDFEEALYTCRCADGAASEF